MAQTLGFSLVQICLESWSCNIPCRSGSGKIGEVSKFNMGMKTRVFPSLWAGESQHDGNP